MRHKALLGLPGCVLLLAGTVVCQQQNTLEATLHGATLPEPTAPLTEIVDEAGLLGLGVAAAGGQVPFVLVHGPLNVASALIPAGSLDLGTPPFFQDVAVLVNGVFPVHPWEVLGFVPPSGSRSLVVPVPAPAGGTLGAFQAFVATPVASQPFRLTAAVDVQTAAGQVHPLQDDDWVEIQFPPSWTFPFFGTSYTSGFICSNGFVTFGSPDPSYQESLPGLLLGPPRVAGLWEDLDPFSGGQVREVLSQGWWRIAWDGVPLFGGTQRVDFEIRLHLNVGDLSFLYGSMENTGGLVGFSPGAAGASQLLTVDLSQGGVQSGPGDTVAELFGGFLGPFDLEGRLLLFEALNPEASAFRSLP